MISEAKRRGPSSRPSRDGRGPVAADAEGLELCSNRHVMPAFVFRRHRQVEIESGAVLAGRLTVDIPHRPPQSPLKPGEKRKIDEIIRDLAAAAQAGSLPDVCSVIGWPGGEKPPNAVDVDDTATMSAWAARSLTVPVDVRFRGDSSPTRH